MVQIITRHGYRPTADAPVRHGAYQHAIEAGYGTEADIHDCNGVLIASTGTQGDRDIRLPDLLDMMDGLNLPLALHIQSSGLAHALNTEMHRHAPPPWFAFGMNPHDMATYVSLGLPIYTQIGAVNDAVPFYDAAAGVCLDPAEQPWIEPRHLAAFLRDKKILCVMDPSSDTHRTWTLLSDIAIRNHPALMLCTSSPAEAANFSRAAKPNKQKFLLLFSKRSAFFSRFPGTPTRVPRCKSLCKPEPNGQPHRRLRRHRQLRDPGPGRP